MDDDDNDVRYAYWTGSSWSTSLLDSFSSSGAELYNLEIVVDSSDMLHVVYCEQYTDELYYSYGDGSSWVTETLAQSSEYPEYCSIAVDSYDLPHIAYFESGSNDATYAYYW